MNKIKSKFILISVLLTGLIAWPTVSYGAFFVKKDTAAVTSGEVNDDLYIMGNNVLVNHRVAEDLFSAAQIIEVREEIGQDAYLLGDTVQVDGAIGDDLYAAGNVVSIMSDRADDVFAFGNMVEIHSKEVAGSVYVGGREVTISGHIKGNVRVVGEAIVIKEGSKIDGDLISYGQNEPQIENNVEVLGQKKHSLSWRKEDREEGNPLIAWVFGVLTWFMTGVVLLYVFKGLTKDVVSTGLTKSGRSLGLGFIGALLVMPITMIFLFSAIGWPIAVVILLLSMSGAILSYGYGIMLVGMWIIGRVKKTATEITWQHILLGATVGQLIVLIPWGGWLIGLVLMLMSFGALLQVLWRKFSLETNVIGQEKGNV